MPVVLLILALVGMAFAYFYGHAVGHSLGQSNILDKMPPPSPDMAYRRSNSIKI